MSRITRPVHFDLLTGFSADVHACMPFLLVLLDVVAELGVHERFLPGHAALFQIFRPKQFLIDAVPQQFLLNVVEVRHPAVCKLL